MELQTKHLRPKLNGLGLLGNHFDCAMRCSHGVFSNVTGSLIIVVVCVISQVLTHAPNPVLLDATTAHQRCIAFPQHQGRSRCYFISWPPSVIYRNGRNLLNIIPRGRELSSLLASGPPFHGNSSISKATQSADATYHKNFKTLEPSTKSFSLICGRAKPQNKQI